MTAATDAGSLGGPLADVLNRRIGEEERARGLASVIEAIASGAIAVERLTRQAALADVLGDTGEINVQGELVQRLDAEGTRLFVETVVELFAVRVREMRPRVGVVRIEPNCLLQAIARTSVDLGHVDSEICVAEEHAVVCLEAVRSPAARSRTTGTHDDTR